jgi:hypothetical protein
MPHCYTWYVIDVLPTAIPSCNSLFESSTDKPTTATIDSNIENNNDDLHMYPTTMIIIIMQTLTNSQVPQIPHQPNTCHQSWLDPSTAIVIKEVANHFYTSHVINRIHTWLNSNDIATNTTTQKACFDVSKQNKTNQHYFATTGLSMLFDPSASACIRTSIIILQTQIKITST